MAGVIALIVSQEIKPSIEAFSKLGRLWKLAQ
jgi:hypothetical protein